MKTNKIADQTLVGAHTSVAGGLHLAVDRALAMGASSMQIFTKSNRSWFAAPLGSEEVELFKASLATSGLQKVVVHAGYLINIAASEASTETNSVKSLQLELSRAEQLGIPYLVLHPGSHTGQGVAVGIKKVVQHLNAILEQATGKTMILLETMAGQGSNLGSTFEEVRDMIDLVTHKKLVGVCFDTCHVFSAGYPFAGAEQYGATLEKFDQTIGFEHLKAFHVNGSKMPQGSHKDRHEELGKGEIPLSTFEALMQDKRFVEVPKILETPTVELYPQEIALLKKFAGNKG